MSILGWIVSSPNKETTEIVLGEYPFGTIIQATLSQISKDTKPLYPGNISKIYPNRTNIMKCSAN